VGFCWESQRARDKQEDLDGGGDNIKIGWVVWSGLIWLGIGISVA
jgi:hypothetical protein